MGFCDMNNTLEPTKINYFLYDEQTLIMYNVLNDLFKCLLVRTMSRRVTFYM